MIFLLEYDRAKGSVIRLDSFPDDRRRDAEGRRLDLELDRLKKGLESEIVLLDAVNEGALRRTHRRYFESLGELAMVCPREAQENKRD